MVREEQAMGSPVGNAGSILESTGLELTPLGQKQLRLIAKAAFEGTHTSEQGQRFIANSAFGSRTPGLAKLLGKDVFNSRPLW